MSNPKHTPGPWIETIADGIGPYKISNGDTVIVAGSMSHANARLIAAAPDLLSACEVVLNNLTTMIPGNRDLQALGEKACIEALTEAINKAKGGDK